MAMIMGSLYSALRKAGVDESDAEKAAEEVADFQKQIADIRSDLSFIKGMAGVTAAGVFALVVKTFFA